MRGEGGVWGSETGSVHIAGMGKSSDLITRNDRPYSECVVGRQISYIHKKYSYHADYILHIYSIS